MTSWWRWALLTGGVLLAACGAESTAGSGGAAVGEAAGAVGRAVMAPVETATWRLAAPAAWPGLRHGHVMAYDGARRRLVLVGGGDLWLGPPYPDTWEWDGSTWVRAAYATGPGQRMDAGMAYDEARRQTVLFGGFAGFGWSTPLAETWSWDGTTWAADAAVRAVEPSASARAVALASSICEIVTSQLGVAELIELVLDRTKSYLGACAVLLYHAERRGQELVLVGHRGLPEASVERHRHVALDAPMLAARAASERREQLVEDTAALDPVLVNTRELVDATGSRSLIALPLLAIGRLIGLLTCTLPLPHRFEPVELEALRMFGGLFGTALATADARQAERSQRLRLEALHDADGVLSEALLASPFDLHAVLVAIAEQARRVVHARYAAVGFDKGSGEPFEPWVAVGMAPEVVAAIGRVPRSVGLLGAVPRTGRAVRLRALREHAEFHGWPPHHPPMTSFLGVPVRFRGEAVGNLYLADKIGADEFSDEDEVAVEMLATRAGIALQQARLRDAITRERDRAEALLHLAPFGILFLGMSGMSSFANPKAMEMLGQPIPAELTPTTLPWRLQRPGGAVLREEERPHMRALAGETVPIEEVDVVRANGTRLRVETSAAPVRSKDGAMLGVAVVYADVSERAALREAIVVQQAHLQAILDGVPRGVLFIDAKSGAVTRNARAAELFGDLPEEGPGYRLQLLDGAPLAASELPHARALAGEAVNRDDLAAVRAGSAPVPVRVSAAPVGATDGAVRGAAMVIEVLDAAAQPRSAAAQWVFTIAHEIRTPLMIMKASLQALHELRTRAELASEAERCLGRSERAADTIERLVTDLTDAARIEAQSFAVHKQPVDVATMVRELAERVTPAAAGAHFRVDATAPAPPTPADPERLEQVLANLFSNAIKYGARGGEIAVEVDRRAEETRIAVTNLGPGIPEDEQPRLFSRFFRARNAAHASGTGLGLYISKGVIEAHGGRMGVETRAEGPTTFWLTLPNAA